jgi:D-glycero-alpha-D-manno-heptose-7-phosphate kinase
VEDVESVDEIRHPVIREALKLMDIKGSVDIDTISDIPAKTGMGSSGTFTVGLLLALHAYLRQSVTRKELAEEAFHIEHDILGNPCGKQDQYIAAIGGVTCFKFMKDDSVVHSPLVMSNNIIANLEDGLMLFFTGYTRFAKDLLADQETKSLVGDQVMLANLRHTKNLGGASWGALSIGDMDTFSNLMDAQWQHKKRRTPGMTNNRIDALYDLAMANGALGGKLIGAGGGGFLMFYTEDKSRLRKTMTEAGLREVRIRFDMQGATIL